MGGQVCRRYVTHGVKVEGRNYIVSVSRGSRSHSDTQGPSCKLLQLASRYDWVYAKKGSPSAKGPFQPTGPGRECLDGPEVRKPEVVYWQPAGFEPRIAASRTAACSHIFPTIRAAIFRYGIGTSIPDTVKPPTSSIIARIIS